MLYDKRYLLLVVFITLGLIVLGMKLYNDLSLSPMSISRGNILKAPLGATPTATAFRPISSTATYIPTDYPTPLPTSTPPPIVIKPVGHKRGVDPIEQPDHQVTIMLLGSDQRENWLVGRTDTMILVTINTKLHTVNVTSFPRDLYVYLPGGEEQRLNAAYVRGGFELLQETMAFHFGIRPDYYILVNFWAFEYFVDDLGGFFIYVPRKLCDERWGGGEKHCVYQGTRHMDGREALWYVRSRETTNDFDRNYRQQLVLEALFNRMVALETLTKIPSLYKKYSKHVTSNLDLGTILSLLPTATKLSDKSLINQYFIGKDAVYNWVTTSGSHVLLPRYDVIRNILKTALNSP